MNKLFNFSMWISFLLLFLLLLLRLKINGESVQPVAEVCGRDLLATW